MQEKAIKAIIALCSIGAIFLIGLTVFQNTPTKEIVHSLHIPKPPVEVAIPTATPTPYSGPVALTVSATSTMTWSSELTPSDFVNIFQLVDPAHGFYASGEATYLITHSYAKGYGAPGNAWEKLVVGDVVGYNNAYYKVDRVSTPAQGAIGSEPIWGNIGFDPDMLVMITCDSRGPGQPATNNYVIRLEKL